MSNQDVFTPSEENNEPGEKQENVFSEYVGPGKKYETMEELAKSAIYAQEYIKSVERERDQLREDVTKQNSLESVLDQITSQQQTTSTTQETPSELSQQVSKPEDIASIIDEKVSDLFTKREQEVQAKTNRDSVNNTLLQKYGERASEVLQAKAAEVGLTLDQIGKMAETSPQAVLAYFKEAGSSAPQRTESSFNTSAVDGISNNIKEGTSAYYSKMRKENPSLYYSDKIQYEMVKKAKELGSSFYQ